VNELPLPRIAYKDNVKITLMRIEPSMVRCRLVATVTDCNDPERELEVHFERQTNDSILADERALFYWVTSVVMGWESHEMNHYLRINGKSQRDMRQEHDERVRQDGLLTAPVAPA
jgi:hypothetical protein